MAENIPSSFELPEKTLYFPSSPLTIPRVDADPAAVFPNAVEDFVPMFTWFSPEKSVAYGLLFPSEETFSLATRAVATRLDAAPEAHVSR